MKVHEIMHDNINYYMECEYLKGGNLEEHILASKDGLDEHTAIYVVKDILLALNYFHKKNIAHRDIKPDNIEFIYEENQGKERRHVKVIDFGFSCFFDPYSGMHMNCGTPEFQAPELLKGTY